MPGPSAPPTASPSSSGSRRSCGLLARCRSTGPWPLTRSLLTPPTDRPAAGSVGWVVPGLTVRQQAGGLIGTPAAPGIGVHGTHVAEHRVDDPPGRFDRGLRGEQPALPVEGGADEPVVGAQVVAGVLGELKILDGGLPADA